jgi:hypothetical protein
MLVQADTINGCYLVDNFEPHTIILNEYDFYDELETLTNDVIGADLDDMYSTIYNEYGIH